ncbi:MAG: DUF4402 domain-containing protein [Desulfobulbus sp.]|jgi:hypothetical protein
MAMKTRQYKKGMWNKWVMGAALCGLVLTPAANALAGDVDVPIEVTVQTSLVEEAETLNFGTIPLSPLGDTITLNATTGAGAEASSDVGVVISDSAPGVITATAAGPFKVTAAYAGTGGQATLEGSGDATGNTLTVTGITANSQGSTAITATDADNDGTFEAVIYVGGVLELASDTVAGPYAGAVTATLTYE